MENFIFCEVNIYLLKVAVETPEQCVKSLQS